MSCRALLQLLGHPARAVTIALLATLTTAPGFAQESRVPRREGDSLHGVGIALAQQRPEPRRSQLGSVMQMIADVRVEIRYSRPVARGRDLFGALVKWGEVWTPGADSATTIEVSRDVRVNGESLPVGKYSVWAVPERDVWTIIFNRQHAAFHTRYPGEAQDALRIRVQPRSGAHMETLTFYFPVVEGYTATLQLHWGTTVVPLGLRAD